MAEVRPLTIGDSTSTYRATQQSTDRAVVLQILHHGASARAATRFEQERAVSALLSGHAGIVPLLETGSTLAGEQYLTRPLYRRGTLESLLTDHGLIPWREATFLVEALGVTLAELHGSNLVHRAVGPHNVLLTDFLLPRLADFGSALEIGRTPERRNERESFFRAPETGVNPADPTMDVYSLGALLWATLSAIMEYRETDVAAVEAAGNPLSVGDTSGPPTVAEATMLARSQLLGSRPGAEAVAEAPRPLRALIARAMNSDPRLRPPSGAAFITELRQAVADADSATPVVTGMFDALDSQPKGAAAFSIPAVPTTPRDPSGSNPAYGTPGVGAPATPAAPAAPATSGAPANAAAPLTPAAPQQQAAAAFPPAAPPDISAARGIPAVPADVALRAEPPMPHQATAAVPRQSPPPMPDPEATSPFPANGSRPQPQPAAPAQPAPGLPGAKPMARRFPEPEPRGPGSQYILLLAVCIVMAVLAMVATAAFLIG
ncbi:MAG: protein kinase [Actinomycetota bacterium]